ncbi:transcription initiation factor TFIID subunit 15b-like [Aristolochia californica]|uniref:transcription initiation factor TFIID subunit 15b-like n=1 Tax=Aristolochia californica TaxID=171875 RepID=UPI0035D71443
MGSRERERDREHQTHQVSSMVVRPADSGGGGGGTSDYEPGEVRRVDNHNDNSFYPRSERFQANQPLGYGMRAGSVSPFRQRKNDQYYGSDFDHPGGPRRGRGFRGGRGSGRFREFSPPYGRGRGSRPYGRGFDVPSFEPGPFRDEGLPRNNPNVSPREGDWICSDPACGNLNFARRSHCNNCNKVRYGPGSGPIGSPQRRFPGPSPPCGAPRIGGSPMDRGPRRDMNGYGSSPPRGWGREFGMGPPPARHGGRFPDNHLPRERPGYHEEDDFRERGKFDKSMPPDWGSPRERRDDFFDDRRGYSGRGTRGPAPLSPPLPPPPTARGNWNRDIRERSRSPHRGPLKDYRRDSYMGRGRDDRRGIRRERVNDSF